MSFLQFVTQHQLAHIVVIASKEFVLVPQNAELNRVFFYKAEKSISDSGFKLSFGSYPKFLQRVQT